MDRRGLPLADWLRPGHGAAMDYVVAALLWLVYPASQTLAMPRWIGIAAAVAAVLPVAFRRRRPLAVLAVTAVVTAILTAFSVNPAPALAPAFVMYLIPLRFRCRDALWLLAGTLLVAAAGAAGFAAIRHGAAGRGGADQAGLLMLESTLLIAGAWLAGYTVGLQRAAAAGRREQAEQRARELLAQARRASSEERLRIARELHDVIAHSLTLIAVQAGVANHVAARQPEQATQALSSIETLSRGALTEMRALLGVLRAGDLPAAGPQAADSPPGDAQAAGLEPAPGLADLDDLVVHTAAAAGVRVDLDVTGPLPPLPAGLDLAVYRVIQEAVTNVVKHAAAGRCKVTVAARPGTLTVEVTDEGRGPGGQQAGEMPGHGLIGMRERVGMYGGEFSAAPLPGRGFRVTASFPLASSAARTPAPA